MTFVNKIYLFQIRLQTRLFFLMLIARDRDYFDRKDWLVSARCHVPLHLKTPASMAGNLPAGAKAARPAEEAAGGIAAGGAGPARAMAWSAGRGNGYCGTPPG